MRIQCSQVSSTPLNPAMLPPTPILNEQLSTILPPATQLLSNDHQPSTITHYSLLIINHHSSSQLPLNHPPTTIDHYSLLIYRDSSTMTHHPITHHSSTRPTRRPRPPLGAGPHRLPPLQPGHVGGAGAAHGQSGGGGQGDRVQGGGLVGG